MAAENTPAPWQADLEAAFPDAEQRDAIDSFLRSKVQPRVTQLEQQFAETANARELWEAITTDPGATYASLTEQMLGEGAWDRVQAAFAEPPAAPPEPTTEEEPPVTPQQPPFDPTVSLTPEEVAAWRHQQELQAYDATLDEILGIPDNADINRDRYHGFVAAADGDFNRAIEMYREDAARARIETLNSLGLTEEQLVELQAKAPAPPVVSEGAGSPVPVQPDYKAEGLSPQDALAKAIEDATHAATANREAPPVS